MKGPFALINVFLSATQGCYVTIWTGFDSVNPCLVVIHTEINVNNNYGTTFLCVLFSSLRDSVFCFSFNMICISKERTKDCWKRFTFYPQSLECTVYGGEKMLFYFLLTITQAKHYNEEFSTLQGVDSLFVVIAYNRWRSGQVAS